MKQVARYRTLSIPNKLRIDVSIIVDDRSPVRTSSYEGNTTTSISINPFITVAISRPWETNDEGNRVKPIWNPNDNLGLTRFTLPVFIRELKGINDDLKIKDLYSYQGSRLELNETKAEQVRRVFMIGQTTLELSPIVIVQPSDEQRVEGIKMKFNNEQSTVELTLNELYSVIYNLEHTNFDSIALALYKDHITKSETPNAVNPTLPKVDIAPKSLPFNADDFI